MPILLLIVLCRKYYNFILMLISFLSSRLLSVIYYFVVSISIFLLLDPKHLFRYELVRWPENYKALVGLNKHFKVFKRLVIKLFLIIT